MLQLKEMIAWLEEITKRKFDYDRLREVLAYSAEASVLYKSFLDMAQYKPSPISIFDALINMAITVYRRGHARVRRVLQDPLRRDHGRKSGKRHRRGGQREIPSLLGEPPGLVQVQGPREPVSARYGGAILTSLYVHAWSLDFDLAKDPLVTLAENYLNRFSNSTIEDRADMAMELFKKYDLNGMIMFMNRSCKAVSFAVPMLKEMLTKRTGIPALVFESDMGDPRFYSETPDEDEDRGLLRDAGQAQAIGPRRLVSSA